MMKMRSLGRWWGVEWAYRPLAVWCSLGLWGVLAVWLWWWLGSVGVAVVGGFLCMLLHWLGEMFHQAGHALVAKQVGHPHSRWVFAHLFVAAQYPKNEPALPTAVHLRRALGGVPASLLVSGIAAVWLFAFTPASPLWLIIVQFVFWENLLLFGLGALFPLYTLTGLGFETDGDTLVRLWRG